MAKEAVVVVVEEVVAVAGEEEVGEAVLLDNALRIPRHNLTS